MVEKQCSPSEAGEAGSTGTAGQAGTGVSSLVKGVAEVKENGVYNSADELPAQ